ncbi:hypothetical protein [Colwellia psychrerythraea]|uniref:BstA-like C-terminal domain-containing protein n=1 Tax=Colwellia psychrerythraea TaxID=28229 RepID=A0A099KI23_COLPS|nr:hypothetical protein [Colwellia psychrerythraea]KGJ90011.1 hypothetical protein ND2E_3567 [Colwellia psychrerythraea]
MSSQQMEIQLSSVTHKTPDGVEMGVMSDGTPYLGARGLATLCGIAPSNIITLIKDWDELKHRSRGKKITELIEAQEGSSIGLYIPIKVNGVNYHAINDINCMAILEYYAFESKTPSEIARNNFRSLARLSLRTFIYEKTGYDPSTLVPDSWRIFHERMTLNEVPSGFFSVFEEMASLLVTSIRKGMPFDNKTMPDISVGQHWGRDWSDKEYNKTFGERIKHRHLFPDDFPQKNPEAWIYPVEALGEFRKWMDGSYLRVKFPSYLANKAKKGALPNSEVKALIEAVQPARL